MSVIFGIREGQYITIAGDKRGTSIAGDVISDSLNKVIVVNNHLAFASAGNAAIAKAIEIDLSKVDDVSNLTTNDLLDIIRSFYQKLISNKSNIIIAMPFYFLLAGKGSNESASLISGGNIKGQLDAMEVPMALFPPADASMDDCCAFFAKNYKLNYSKFVERTVYDISGISQLVSSTGDKWVYHIKSQEGVLSLF